MCNICAVGQKKRKSFILEFCLNLELMLRVCLHSPTLRQVMEIVLEENNFFMVMGQDILEPTSSDSLPSKFSSTIIFRGSVNISSCFAVFHAIPGLFQKLCTTAQKLFFRHINATFFQQKFCLTRVTTSLFQIKELYLTTLRNASIIRRTCLHYFMSVFTHLNRLCFHGITSFARRKSSPKLFLQQISTHLLIQLNFRLTIDCE